MKVNIFYAVAVSALCGCGDSSISEVKNHASSNPSYTYGQILDHRASCKSQNWNSSKDKNDRNIVEYKCMFSVNKETLDDIYQASIREIEREGGALERRYEAALHSAGIILTNSKNNLQRLQESPNTDEKYIEQERTKLSKAQETFNQVENYREKWSATIDKIKAHDADNAKALLGKPTEAYQKIIFLINKNQVSIIGHEYYIDDKKTSANFEDLALFAMEMGAPQNTTLPAAWQEHIKSKIAATINLEINKFPLKCNYETGCSEVMRVQQ